MTATSSTIPTLPRDVIVIGASAGGIEAVSKVLSALPRGFPAALLVTQHISPRAPSMLAEVFDRLTPLETTFARHGEAIQCGRVYLAPSNHHLVIRDNTLLLGHGPRENGARPAIDVLFRSAAAEYGPRVIGVLLSGSMDDGTAGFAAIQERGGTTIAQDPGDALFPSMPRSAIDHTRVDHVVAASAIGLLLARLVAERAPARELGPVPSPMLMEIETAIGVGSHPEEAVGQQPSFGCPDCGGPLAAIEDSAGIRFRCHVGHAWSAGALARAQSTAIEDALWTAIRWLDEEEMLSGYGAQRSRSRGNEGVAQLFEKRAKTARGRSTKLRGVLAREEKSVGPEGE